MATLIIMLIIIFLVHEGIALMSSVFNPGVDPVQKSWTSKAVKKLAKR